MGVHTNRIGRVVVIDGEVLGFTSSKEAAEHVHTADVDDSLVPMLARNCEHVSRATEVCFQNLLCCCRCGPRRYQRRDRVVLDCGQMDNSVTSLPAVRHTLRVENIVTFEEVQPRPVDAGLGQ
jgi:hypothetical protein